MTYSEVKQNWFVFGGHQDVLELDVQVGNVQAMYVFQRGGQSSPDDLHLVQGALRIGKSNKTSRSRAIRYQVNQVFFVDA